VSLKDHENGKQQRQLDKMSDENHELRSENKILRDEIGRTNNERDHLRDWLLELAEKIEQPKGGKKRKGRLGKLVLVGIAGLATWALGSTAGRRKLAEMKEMAGGGPGDFQRQVSETLHSQ
jgi:hypothetical protein